MISSLPNRDMNKSLVLISIVLFVFFTQKAEAAYIAIGPIQGTVCKGFVVEICGPERIDAEKGADGKLHPISIRYPDVQRFSPDVQGGNTGICVFYDTNSWLTFQQQGDGTYKRIDADWIDFKCKKTE